MWYLQLVAVTGAGPCGGTRPIIWLPDPSKKATHMNILKATLHEIPLNCLITNLSSLERHIWLFLSLTLSGY